MPLLQSFQASPSHFGTPLRRFDSVEENMTMLSQILVDKA
jgi:hypothetical protein